MLTRSVAAGTLSEPPVSLPIVRTADSRQALAAGVRRRRCSTPRAARRMAFAIATRGARAVRDDDEAVQARGGSRRRRSPGRAASRTRRAAGRMRRPAEPCRRIDDSSSARSASSRLRHRPLERLQCDVAREPVRDDDVGAALEEARPSVFPAKCEIGCREQLVRLERQLVALLVAPRRSTAAAPPAGSTSRISSREHRAHVRELDEVLGCGRRRSRRRR